MLRLRLNNLHRWQRHAALRRGGSLRLPLSWCCLCLGNNGRRAKYRSRKCDACKRPSRHLSPQFHWPLALETTKPRNEYRPEFCRLCRTASFI